MMRRRQRVKLYASALTVVLFSAGPAMAAPPGGAPATPPPAKPATPPKMFWGGGMGLSFGDVDYVSLSPWFGYWITPKVAAGVGLEYTYRNDKRYSPDLSTSDYGGSLFTRVTVAQGFFAAAEYEYLNYEYLDTTAQTISDGYSSFFVGGGIAQPMGSNAALIVSAMYNLSWSDGEASPYDSPYVVTVGVSVGF